MDYRGNQLTSTELGAYVGILAGIAVLQTTEQMVGLVICPLIGLALGRLLDHITDQINIRLGWSAEK